MKSFEIEIKETLSKIIEIKAHSESEALDLVYQQYNQEEVVLDSSDFIDVEIKNTK